MAAEGRPTAVLLLNMGGPDSPAAVRPFLFNLFSDRRILGLPAPLRYPLAYLLCTLRARKVRPRYEAIGGGSPLPDITRAQGLALTEELARRRLEAHSYPAFRYWYPLVGEALDRALEKGAARVVALSLFPQYCGATTGSCLDELDRALRRRRGYVPPVTVVDRWPDHPGYLDALAGTVREALDSLLPEERERAQIVFSAHGVPVSLIKKGDPYLGEVEHTVRGMSSRLGGRPWRLAFQSKMGPLRWLSPSLGETLAALAKEGVPPVLVVPLSFVSDHIETLHELDIEYAQKARALGITRYLRAPALNTRPDFIAALADLVISAE